MIKPEYSCIAVDFMIVGLVAVNKLMRPVRGSLPDRVYRGARVTSAGPPPVV